MQTNPDEANLAAAADKPASDTSKAADTGDGDNAGKRQGRNDNAKTNENTNEKVQKDKRDRQEPKPKVRQQQNQPHAMCCLECAGAFGAFGLELAVSPCSASRRASTAKTAVDSDSELPVAGLLAIHPFSCSPCCAAGCQLPTTSKQVEPAPKVELPFELPADTKVSEVDGKECFGQGSKAGHTCGPCCPAH